MSRWGFGRRSKGRHALGAAVTELPSAPVRVAPAPVLPIAAAMVQPAAPPAVPADGAPEPPSYVELADGRLEPPLYLEPSDAELEWLGLLDPTTPPGEQTADEVVGEEPWPELRLPAPEVSANELSAPEVSALVPHVDGLLPLPADPLLDPLDAVIASAGADAARVASLLQTAAAWGDSSEPSGLPRDLLEGAADVLLADVPLYLDGGAPTGPAVEPDAQVDAPFTPAVPMQATGRVQLGFRDGTTASLDPDSEQAHALEELALMLNARH